MILDATAGNRMMWPNKNPLNVIFLDKEIGLAVPPDIFADHRFCPFRDNVFECIFYDPPFGVKMPPWWRNPGWDIRRKKSIAAFYGNVDSKRELFRLVYDAQKEFQRLTKRLCLKWAERNVKLWNILPFFRDWKIIQTKKLEAKIGKNSFLDHHKHIYWVTMVRTRD